MSRESTKAALDRYLKKQIKPKRSNSKPEKLVEKACVAWMRSLNWDVDIYESKATFNPRIGRYVGKSIKAGTVDCQGVMPGGIFIAVEFKALGKLKTFNRPNNYKQKQYLVSKIKNGAFGCVVDSLERLKQIYLYWSHLPAEAKEYFLMTELP